jgi:hypothetical protein
VRWLPPLVLAASLVAVPWRARALSITVSPLTVDMVVPAGSSQQVPITVANRGEAPLEFRAYLFDWSFDDSQSVYPPPGSTERSAALWSSVLPQRMTLDPGTRDRFDLVVSPPEDARAGYFAVLFIDTGLPTVQAENGEGAFALTGRIGVVLAVRIQGTGTDALQVEDVRVDPPSASTPLSIETVIYNLGDVHANAESRVVVVDAEGQVRAKLAGRRPFVLPGQTRTIESEWGGQLDDGTYTALVTVTYGDGAATTAEKTFRVGVR